MALSAFAGATAQGQKAEKRPDFARDIRPILAQSCLACHGSKRQDGGLRLDVRSRALEGGDSGKALIPGDPAGSDLLSRLTTDDAKHRMPLGAKPLPPAQVELIRRWIQAGAEWPDEAASKEPYREHWSFRPVRRPAVPKVNNAARVRSPIDAFVIAKLEAHGLALSPEADRPTLVRRLHLDLIGLPPTPAEVDAFVADRAPDAYEKLVDRLLASPHFGERWGRHWLDLARFAESDGYENDRIRGDAWRYRDWVVDAVNRDLPFNQFTVDQLAGDLVAKPTPEQRIAVGLHRNTLWNSAASADKEEFRTYAVKDRTDTTGAVWMGLTVGCAKCHTHKYDPISQKEYYQLYAFFNNVDEEDVTVPGGKAQSLKAVQRENYVHLRGSFLQKGPAIKPGAPAFLPPLKPRGAEADRLDLARWLTDPKHPLTPRVAVNRTWQHLFGQGLVPTPENFGLSGQRPVQVELLDWLAAAFAAGARGQEPGARDARSPELGWSQKGLIRLVVTSSVYRQASDWRPEVAEQDPENALLARQNRYRVEAEIVRDLSLSVSGLLDLKLGGPSIVPPFPKGLLEQRFTNEALRLPGAEHHRRGIYVHVQRTLTHPSLAAFDVADGNQACIRRDRSITPIQALTLLNDPVFAECARALGERLRKSSPDRDERLRLGFRLCCGRAPAAEELAVLVQLVETQRRLGASEEQAWAGVGRALLNLEEFTTRE
ncbi:MAG: PSD1 and planctomycete cytochrome C domain-containing protein [Actinomycetota bacterium]